MNGRTVSPSDQSVEKAAVFPTASPSRASRDAKRALADNTAQKQRAEPFGTGRAVKKIVSSEASPPAGRWGGSRNSGSRTGDSLSLEQAANIMEAAQFAAAAGMPFNRHLTIHWQQAGIPDERAAWATGRFMKLAGDWIAKRGGSTTKTRDKYAGRFAWAWVRENGDRKGSHVHILLHLPAELRIGNMQRRWLRSITGRPYRARTIRTARIGGTAGAAQSTPAVYEANLAAVVGYLLKGASPKAARELGIERLEPGGRINGKRAATSQNVGWAARLRQIARVRFRPVVDTG